MPGALVVISPPTMIAIAVRGLEVRICTGEDASQVISAAVEFAAGVSADVDTGVHRLRGVELSLFGSELHALLARRYDFGDRLYDADAAAVATFASDVDKLYHAVMALSYEGVTGTYRKAVLRNKAVAFYDLTNEIAARNRCATPAPTPPAPVPVPKPRPERGISSWWLIPIVAAVGGGAYGASVLWRRYR